MPITNSTNMNLPVPVVSQEPGPNYAIDLNNCLSIIDGHNHSAGSGVQITPSGLNINGNLTFNTNSATSLLSATFVSQSSPLTGTNFISFSGGNLYVNDGSGNQIQVTSGGGVAGSPGSIGSLSSPAAATYSSGSKSFIWTAASGKAAAMDNGAVTIRQTNVASSAGVTLVCNASISGNYQFTFPTALPGSTQYMTSDSSGNLTFSTANAIGSAMTSTGANAVLASATVWPSPTSSISNSILAASTSWPSPATSVANSVAAARTRAVTTDGTDPGVGGVSISQSSSTFATGSSSPTAVTHLSCTLTTSGRPVYIACMSDGSTNDSSFLANGNDGVFYISNGSGGRVSTQILPSAVHLPPSALSAFDTPVAGSITYNVLVAALPATSVNVSNVRLVVYEL